MSLTANNYDVARRGEKEDEFIRHFFCVNLAVRHLPGQHITAHKSGQHFSTPKHGITLLAATISAHFVLEATKKSIETKPSCDFLASSSHVRISKYFKPKSCQLAV